MPFNPALCRIPTVYCGNGDIPQPRPADNIRYTGRGTPNDCMKKGFGAGSAVERLKHLPETSLQRIKYVGEKYEQNFRARDIQNQRELKAWVRNKTSNQIKELLKFVFRKRDGVLDSKAYNSTLIFLNNYDQGIDLPECKQIP